MLFVLWNPNSKQSLIILATTVEPLKVDCAVCAVDPIKLVLHFVQFKYLRKFDDENYFFQQ